MRIVVISNKLIKINSRENLIIYIKIVLTHSYRTYYYYFVVAWDNPSLRAEQPNNQITPLCKHECFIVKDVEIKLRFFFFF
jgi:hypothetical protein